ncbi:MAG: EamA family transporter RarD [Gammaproteobacteria bacterium]|nr:EamA family transporter RarD [Gammaproteobacteria bacterium]MDH5592722.1 EamA family transporter RarD [Gammaproteobacteria bacterium]
MQGLILAVAAYTIWGFFPLFFSYLSDVSPVEVLSHRIIWSLVATLFIGILLKRGGKLLTALQDKKLIGWLALASLLIAINWLTYIWAIGNHRVLESSLGYFITPVVSLILAKMFFKEHLHPLQAWAGIIAVLAIVWELISLGQLPWVSLVLAFAFALYGVVKKHCSIDGINGLTIETLWLLPLALAWISWQQPHTLAFGSSQTMTLLLISSGIITALPLVLFAMATRRINLSVVGFIMYINPTMQFLIGVFVLKEAYPPERMVTFVLIWFALSLFVMGLWQLRKNRLKTH